MKLPLASEGRRISGFHSDVHVRQADQLQRQLVEEKSHTVKEEKRAAALSKQVAALEHDLEAEKERAEQQLAERQEEADEAKSAHDLGMQKIHDRTEALLKEKVLAECRDRTNQRNAMHAWSMCVCVCSGILT